MKVKTIRVQNLKAIGEFEANLNGCTVLVTGKNNSGKSTLLRALPDRLRGIKPDVVLKHNESEGFAEWELTDGVKLIWSFDDKTKKGERLIIITHDAAGNELKGSITEELMNKYFPEIFDVDAFLQGTPAAQRKILQKISGLNFQIIDDRYKVAYEDRTFKNKKRDDAQLQLKPVNASLAVKEEETDEIIKEINLIDSHNEKYEGIQKGVTEKEAKLPQTKREISRLKLLLKAAEDEEKQLTKQISDDKVWLEADKNKPKDEAYLKALNDRLDKIDESNEAIVLNNKHIKAKQDFEVLKKAAEDADKAVKAIIKEKDDMISKANMPEGFGFSDDGITYNGLPFTREHQSSSAIYIAALKVASMSLGEVKMLHFDASFLDKNSLSEIEKWANANDLQLLIERPDFEAGDIQYELINEIA